MTTPTSPSSDQQPILLVDDRLLVAILTGQALPIPDAVCLHTTAYWYYRASRAAAIGAAGQLSGPFRDLGPAGQIDAIRLLLNLPDDFDLPAPRSSIPAMVDVHRRHPRLNLLNVEAVATALLLGATVLLSPPSASGLLTAVLDQERIPWRALDVPA